MDNSLTHRTQNKEMQDSLISSIKSIFPLENNGKKLILSSIEIRDDLDDFDFPAQKEVKLNRKSWHVPIYANFELFDTKTGRPIDTIKSMKIGYIPKLTNRFSTIIDGNEYQTTNQLRRKSGVYSRLKQNGELESEFNLEKGHNFKMQLDPTTQLFVVLFANRKYKLWSLLSTLGITDSEIEKFWGRQLLDINKKGALNSEATEMTSIYKKLFNKEPKTYQEVQAGINQYFNETKLDPESTEFTLGEGFEKVTGKTLLQASRKLLNINKGTDVPDERDSLIFKDLYTIDNLITFYFDKQATVIKKKLTRSVGLKDKVREIISASVFGEPIKHFFTTGDLSTTPPQTNPVAIVDAWRKTTPMGTGGIGSMHAITMETRDVQPSHLGFLDSLSTPESMKVGVTVGLASEVQKLNGRLTTPVLNKKGEMVRLTPKEIYKSTVAFPDQYNLKNSKLTPIAKEVKALIGGKVQEISAEDVDYYLLSPKSMFSLNQNLVPFLANTQGNRASTGARMITQALALDNPEAPLLRNRRGLVSTDNGAKVIEQTFEDLFGSYLNPSAPVDGKIEKINSDYIFIKPTTGGEAVKIGLYKDFPLNQDGYLNSNVLVKEGDTVKKGDILTESNYSVGRTLALGKNLNVAYLSYKGYNFEDGAVISEDAAKKLSHTMIHKVNIYFSPKLSIFDKKKFNAWFPDTMETANFSKLDDMGIIKVGQTVNPNEVVCAYLVEKELDDIDQALSKLDKYTFRNYSKNITYWDEDEPGVVSDVRINGRNIDIYIKASHPLKEGDKISGLWGNKSIITKILPIDDMPHRLSGEPLDVLMSPEGVPGRMNIGQILSTAAGKLADKTGKPYIVDNFANPDGDAAAEVKKQLEDNGIEVDEILRDGKSGELIKTPIFTGKQYIIKLRHFVKKKQAMHELGPYDINEQPAGKGAQKIGILDTYAYLAHGAKKNLFEMGAIKSRKNEDFWRDIQFGLPPGRPARNFVFEKFVTYLKGAGVNVEKQGNNLKLLPFTDKDVMRVSKGELTDPGAMLIGKNLASRKGGLFDAAITGGVHGANWSHITLTDRIPNPMFDDAIIKSLNLTEAAYDKIISGKADLGGKTGVAAIIGALDKVNVDKELVRLKAELKVTAPTNVNKLNTRIKYLQSLKTLNLTPKEAYTMDKVAIIPPQFRPIYALPSGDLMVSDINKHYRDVGLINQTFKKIKPLLTDKDIITNQENLYKSVKAMQGFIDPINYSKEKYKGFLGELEDIKFGLIHGTNWTKTQDLSARSTITVEPTLGLDQVGLPHEMAYTIMKPFVINEMKNQGFKVTDALKNYNDETDIAKNALTEVLKTRPVILNRAPTLHKHGVQAFWPVITSGRSIKLNPLIVKGYNADFDGDEQLNSVYINLLDTYVENYYIKVLNFKKEWFEERKIMASRFNTYLPYLEGSSYYVVNLEDFPFNAGKLKGVKDHISFYEAEKFIKVVAYDEKKQEFVLATVEGWSVHKDREVWTINLNNKHQILSDDDERAVYGLAKGTFEFTRNRPSNALGMLVPIAKNLTDVLPLVGDTIQSIAGEGKLLKTIHLSKQVGYVIGALAGDGWVDSSETSPNRVNITGIEKSVIGQYTKCLKHIFIEEPHIGHLINENSYGQSEKHVISSVDYASLVLPLIGKGAKNKHLPAFWFKAPRDFKIGLLSGLLDTDGSISITHGKEKPQLQLNISSTSIRLLQETQQMLLTLGVRSKISSSKKTCADNDFWVLSISSVEIQAIKDELVIAHEKNLEALNSVTPGANSASYVKTDLVPMSAELGKKITKIVNHVDHATLYAIVNKSSKSGFMTRDTAKRILAIIGEEFDTTWTNFIKNENVTWMPVTEVENTGKKETGYDLTVPGYETFMSVDGIILSNTMSVMTPVSREAVDEAKTFLPSKILFKHGDNSLVPELTKDYLYGIYELSQLGNVTGKSFKTLDDAKKAKLGYTDQFLLNGKLVTIGQVLINAPLPEPLRNYTRPLNSKNVKTILKTLGTDYPDHFNEVISTWKDIGANYSYIYGHTISLNDFTHNKDYRNNLIKELKPKLKGMSEAEKITAYNKLTKDVEKAQVVEFGKTKNNFFKMLESGTLSGSKSFSITQVASMPGVITDVKGDPIAIPILKSYGEGLDSASYWNHMYGVRKGTVDRSVNTRESGALNKSILNVNRRLLITIHDCNTIDGINLKIDDKDLIGRTSLETILGVIKRNEIISSTSLLKAKEKNVLEIKVRSPLSCEAPDGICQLCYGAEPGGEIPAIGTNVGILDSQAVTERATQLTMQTFHSGGAATAGGGLVAGFPRLEQLVKVPEKIGSKATLAETSGAITKIEKSPIGGHFVYVNNVKHIIPPGLNVIAEVGKSVAQGDSLSEGIIKPQELGELKSHRDAQNYLVEEGLKIYGPEWRKSFETVVRGISDNAVITSAPEDSGFLRGDKASPSYLNYLNKKRLNEGLEKIEYSSYFKSTDTLNTDTDDWFTRMTTNRVKDALRQSVSKGAISSIKGKDPIPAYIYADEFGKNTNPEKGEFY